MKLAYQMFQSFGLMESDLRQRHPAFIYVQYCALTMVVLMQGLNCNWFYKILMGVQRVITGGKDQMKSGSRDADHTEKDQKPKDKEG